MTQFLGFAQWENARQFCVNSCPCSLYHRITGGPACLSCFLTAWTRKPSRNNSAMAETDLFSQKGRWCCINYLVTWLLIYLIEKLLSIQGSGLLTVPDRRNCFSSDSCLKSTLMRLISCPAVVEFLSPIKDWTILLFFGCSYSTLLSGLISPLGHYLHIALNTILG